MNRGDLVSIICFKHDGHVHRAWHKCMYVFEDENYIVLSNDNALVYEDDGRIWKVKEPTLYIFDKKEWYNVIAMVKNDGIKFYVNVASIPYFNGHELCYIDYDLDVSKKPDNPIKILDENEYLLHYQNYKYNLNIDYKCKDVIYKILKKMEKDISPFNHDVIFNWFDIYDKIKEEKNENNTK